ncbi:pyridoxal reductase [Skeletonema marinoi]|uniref:Pyridoxal reductase n=1 Tax=Skeletonema marinoi TaxID=267567 RepID=A0AAD9D5J4_9STRA|nr:pyridoxal reductase [Skeletonema marinoi]
MTSSAILFASLCLALAAQTVTALVLPGTKTIVGRVSAGPIEISALGCGTWSWGNRLLWDYDPSQDEEIYRAYREIRDAGVTIFDTSRDSLGQFERRYLEEKSSSKSMFGLERMLAMLATNSRVTRGSYVKACKESLKRLEQDKLAIAQTHWSTANYNVFQEGALGKLGKFSNRMKERNVPIAVAQVQYSLMTARNNEILDACDDAGCRLISYSPLCLGLLTGKYNLDNLPREGNPRRQLFRELLPGAQQLLGTLDAVAKDVGKTQSQVAINWAISKGTVPIPGARNLQQAQENLGAVGWKLSNAAVQELDNASAGVNKKMIENIFQTR